MNSKELQTYIMPFRQFDWHDIINTIHIAQKIYTDHPDINLQKEEQTTIKYLIEHSTETNIAVTRYHELQNAHWNNHKFIIGYSTYSKLRFYTDQETFCFALQENDNSYFLKTKDQNELSNFINYVEYLALINNLCCLFSNNNAKINSLAKLIYYQTQNINNGKLYQQTENKTLKPTVNPKIRQLLERLQKNITDSNYYNSHNHTQITVSDLVSLIVNLQQHRLLNETQAAWLLEQNSEDTPFIKDFVNKYQLEEKLTPCAKIPTELTDLVQKLSTKCQVHIFERQQQTSLSPGTKIFWGVHGTKAVSIPSIINEGLKNSASLSKEGNNNYTFTGDSLGTGVYFARLNQFQKAINYTEGKHSSYLLVAQVAYHKAKHVKEYRNPHLADGEDLIVGDRVGSYDRDEIVAPNNTQINTKYLLELIPK